MMPMLTNANIPNLDPLLSLGTPFLIKKLSSGAESTANISQISQNKVTIHFIPTHSTLVECPAHSVTQAEPIPTANLRFHHPNQANTIQ